MTSAARLVVALALVLGACKPSAAPQPPTPAPDTPTSSEDERPAPEPGATGEPPTCAAEGTPWDGKPGTCFYEHGRCCYPSPEAMCAAAGCEPERCIIMESSPAQARCSDPAPTS